MAMVFNRYNFHIIVPCKGHKFGKIYALPCAKDELSIFYNKHLRRRKQTISYEQRYSFHVRKSRLSGMKCRMQRKIMYNVGVTVFIYCNSRRRMRAKTTHMPSWRRFARQLFTSPLSNKTSFFPVCILYSYIIMSFLC